MDSSGILGVIASSLAELRLSAEDDGYKRGVKAGESRGRAKAAAGIVALLTDAACAPGEHEPDGGQGGNFARATSAIWDAPLGYRHKAALQALLNLVNNGRGQMYGDHAVVDCPSRYVADILSVAPCTASRTVGQLHDLGLVTRTVERNEGRGGADVTTTVHIDKIAALCGVDTKEGE